MYVIAKLFDKAIADATFETVTVLVFFKDRAVLVITHSSHRYFTVTQWCSNSAATGKGSLEKRT
jgi:hypothetical protein